MSPEQFAPKINKKSAQMAARQREGRIEDHLLKEGQKKKQRLEELEQKKTATTKDQSLRKVSDKYILQKFNREFE